MFLLFKYLFSYVSTCFYNQVARAGRFGTKGLAITFVSDEKDAKILNEVQDRFEVNVGELPEEIDLSSYSKWHYLLKLSWYNFLKCANCLHA